MKQAKGGIAMRLIDAIRRHPTQALVLALSLGYLLLHRLRRQAQVAATHEADTSAATRYQEPISVSTSASSGDTRTPAANPRAADALANELLYGTDADLTDGIGVVEAGLSATDASSTIDAFADDTTRTAGAELADQPAQDDPQSDIPEMTDLPPLDPATLAQIASVMANDHTLSTDNSRPEDAALDRDRTR